MNWRTTGSSVAWISATLPTWRIAPSCSMAMRSPTLKALRMSWVTTSPVTPRSRVRITIAPAGDALTVMVTNTLTGTAHLEQALSAGTGLASMRERAILAGGELRAGPEGGLWRVQATLPLGSS